MIKTNKPMSKEELEYLRNDVVVDNLNNINKEMDKINQRIQLMFEVLIQLDENFNRLDYDRRLAKAEDEARRANSEVEYLKHDRAHVWKRTDELRSHMRDINRYSGCCGMPCETMEAVN
jgi:chromosome segregation ATPase